MEAKKFKYSIQDGFDSPFRQSFPLPQTFMNYVTTKWSTQVYEKLIQTCKHFFASHRIVVIPNLLHYDYKPEKCLIESTHNVYFTATLDLSIIKLWPTKRYGASSYLPVTREWLKVFYKFEVTELVLSKQTINVDDFLFMSEGVRDLKLYNSKIVDSNNMFLDVSEILTLMPKLTEFSLTDYSDDFYSLEVPDASTLPKNLEFIQITAYIDPDELCQFIKMYPIAEYSLDFDEADDRNVFKTAVREAFPDGCLKLTDEYYTDADEYQILDEEYIYRWSWVINETTIVFILTSGV